MAIQTPEFLQTKKYKAIRDRLALAHGGAVQAGVWDATDLKVTQRAAGATMSVDVNLGYALVAANSPSNRGLYHVESDAIQNIGIAASHATLPRIDQVILHVYDSTDGGAAQDAGIIEVITGTATAGATLDNRTGFGALPTNSLLVGDVLVPAASSTVVTANIRDRRPWARGANSTRIGVAPDYSLGNNVVTEIADLRQRIECSGAPVLIEGWCNLYNNLAPITTHARLHMDGVLIPGTRAQQTLTAANNPSIFVTQTVVTPTPGSHLFCLAGGNNGGGVAAAVSSTTNENPGLHVRELLSPTTNNGTV